MMNPDLGLRASARSQSNRSARLAIKAGLKTLVFAQTRLMVEVLTKYLKDIFDHDPRKLPRIRAYRGGYLPTERREVEPQAAGHLLHRRDLGLAAHAGDADADVDADVDGTPCTAADEDTGDRGGFGSRRGRKRDRTSTCPPATQGARLPSWVFVVSMIPMALAQIVFQERALG